MPSDKNGQNRFWGLKSSLVLLFLILQSCNSIANAEQRQSSSQTIVENTISQNKEKTDSFRRFYLKDNTDKSNQYRLNLITEIEEDDESDKLKKGHKLAKQISNVLYNQYLVNRPKRKYHSLKFTKNISRANTKLYLEHRVFRI